MLRSHLIKLLTPCKVYLPPPRSPRSYCSTSNSHHYKVCIDISGYCLFCLYSKFFQHLQSVTLHNFHINWGMYLKSSDKESPGE